MQQFCCVGERKSGRQHKASRALYYAPLYCLLPAQPFDTTAHPTEGLARNLPPWPLSLCTQEALPTLPRARSVPPGMAAH